MTLRAFRQTPWGRPQVLVGCVILLAILAAAVFAPLLFPEGPWPAVGTPYTPPFQSTATPLGTDTLGRDVVAGLLYGARVSLIVAVGAGEQNKAKEKDPAVRPGEGRIAGSFWFRMRFV